jgi:hypothetical protein
MLPVLPRIAIRLRDWGELRFCVPGFVMLRFVMLRFVMLRFVMKDGPARS